MPTVVGLGALAFVACSTPPRSSSPSATSADPAITPAEASPAGCQLGHPAELLVDQDGAVLERWDLVSRPVLFSEELPVDEGLARFRAELEAAGANHRRPIADPPQPKDDAERDMWRKEHENLDLTLSGKAGRVRPIRCLEALLFAHHHARVPQLETPTEFISAMVRNDEHEPPMLRVYFGAGREAFPPKAVYGLEQAKADVAAGWTFWGVLHNHPIQKNTQQANPTEEGPQNKVVLPALGAPTLSTSDVQLMRALAADAGLERAWVTNGFFTADVPAEAFELLHAR